MNQTLPYRAELIACNLAIQTISSVRPLRSKVMKAVGALQAREIPVWASTLAASSFGGLLVGFIFYVIIA